MVQESKVLEVFRGLLSCFVSSSIFSAFIAFLMSVVDSLRNVTFQRTGHMCSGIIRMVSAAVAFGRIVELSCTCSLVGIIGM